MNNPTEQHTAENDEAALLREAYRLGYTDRSEERDYDPGHALDLLGRTAENGASSYHDLHVTTKDIERVSIFDMPYGYEVTCTRVGGWQLWLNSGARKVAGEYDEGLRLDVGGHVICDSLTRRG